MSRHQRELLISSGRVTGDQVRVQRGQEATLTEIDLRRILDLYAECYVNGEEVELSHLHDLALHPNFPTDRLDDLINAKETFGLSQAETEFLIQGSIWFMNLSNDQFWHLHGAFPVEGVTCALVNNRDCPTALLEVITSRDIADVDMLWTALMASLHKNLHPGSGPDLIDRIVTFATEENPKGFDSTVVAFVLNSLTEAAENRDDFRHEWISHEHRSRVLVAVACT